MSDGKQNIQKTEADRSVVEGLADFFDLLARLDFQDKRRESETDSGSAKSESESAADEMPQVKNRGGVIGESPKIN